GNKFLFVFSKILPRTAFLVMLSLRFIPLVRLRLIEIMAVQHVRGTSLVTGPVKYRAKNGMNFLKILLTWSLEEAIQTADAMKTRGYGLGKKSAYLPWYFGKRDLFVFIFLALLFSFSVFAGIFGYGKIVIYPALGTLEFFFLDICAYMAMILLIGFPIIVEGREALKWHN